MAIQKGISKVHSTGSVRVRRLKNIFKGDKIIWTIFFTLCLISIVEVYSSSSVLGYKTGNYWHAALFHAVTLGAGIVLMVLISNMPCRYFKAVMPVCVIISVPLLLWVLFFGAQTNGAARWIDLGFIQFQPSELAKGTMILVTAQILSRFQTPMGASPKAFKNIMLAAVFLILPIIPENFSTGFLLSLVVFIMMLIGRVPAKQLGLLCSIVAALASLFVFLVMAVGDADKANPHRAEDGKQLVEVVDNSGHNLTEGNKDEDTKPNIFTKLTHRLDTWKARIIKHFNGKEVAPEDYDLDKDGQVGFAHIAIASSNFIGKGPGNSEMRDFLPLAFSDFIFAVIFEELGMTGAALVVLLYLILLFRTGVIAKNCVNSFPAFLAMGLALLIVVQAMFNMMVAVGWLPVTGQPLPLLSKGGTSSILNCIYIGMIISVSRTAKKRTEV